MTRRQLIGVSPFIAWAALMLAAPHFPFEWGHTLSAGCEWAQRGGVGFLGPTERDSAAKRAEFACWERHGLKSPDWHSVKQLMRKWPTQAQLTAWNGESHEIGRSFRPGE